MTSHVKPETDVKRYTVMYNGMPVRFVIEEDFDSAVESAARAENARMEAEAEFRRNGIDGENIVDALIFGFNMVYTSPAWGDDERTPEGWKKKEKALRKAFTATIKKVITLFAVGADYFKERVRVSNDSLQIKMKEVELLRTALRAAEERARVAEEALAAESLLHDLTRMACDKLRSELEECKARKGKAVAYRTVTEAENARLTSEVNTAHSEIAGHEEEVSRLTAEVDEWKKKAEANDILNTAIVGAIENGQYNLAVDLIGRKAEIESLRSELTTLRRTSVRVDVLLRWVESRKLVVGRLYGNPKIDVWGALGPWMQNVLTRRSLRKENETQQERR